MIEIILCNWPVTMRQGMTNELTPQSIAAMSDCELDTALERILGRSGCFTSSWSDAGPLLEMLLRRGWEFHLHELTNEFDLVGITAYFTNRSLLRAISEASLWELSQKGGGR